MALLGYQIPSVTVNPKHKNLPNWWVLILEYSTVNLANGGSF